MGGISSRAGEVLVSVDDVGFGVDENTPKASDEEVPLLIPFQPMERAALVKTS